MLSNIPNITFTFGGLVDFTDVSHFVTVMCVYVYTYTYVCSVCNIKFQLNVMLLIVTTLGAT